MMRREAYVLPMLLLATIIGAAISYGSTSGSLYANVNVPCPFALSLGIKSAYVNTGIINTNYTIYTLSSCGISNATGNFIIRNQTTGAIVYNALLYSGPVSQIVET